MAHLDGERIWLEVLESIASQLRGMLDKRNGGSFIELSVSVAILFFRRSAEDARRTRRWRLGLSRAPAGSVIQRAFISFLLSIVFFFHVHSALAQTKTRLPEFVGLECGRFDADRYRFGLWCIRIQAEGG